jgi:L-ascorbate metabolism protein UlaG (beta-lactamase superfamily)
MPTAYLRPDVMAEPLVNRWYATSYLISPMTAPLMVANRHIPTMRSFVSAPQLHVNALKNPEMSGGAYISYGADRVDEIKAVLAETQQTQAPLIAFAEAVAELDKILSREAKGSSMDPLYSKVPAPLKGYVELTYDLQSQPAMRIIEGLLYHSPVYQPEAQSVALSRCPGDERPYVLTSPRLDDPGQILVKQPFDAPAWDALFRSVDVGADPAALAEQLGIAAADRDLFAGFFTETSPPRREPYRGDGVRIRYFGHACVLLETAEVSILVDAQVGYPNADGPARFTFLDLPETLDYVIFTHSHHDHVIFQSLLPIRHKIRNLVIPKNGSSPADPSLKLVFQHTGFPTPYELEEMESIALPGGGTLTGLPFLGEHGDLNIRSKNAYHVKLRGRSFFLGADSDNLDHELYHHITRVTGPVDVLFMGLECDGAPQSWIYGPLAPRKMSRQMDQSRRLCSSDFPKCVAMMEHFKPRQVYIYAMGREPWLTYLTSLEYTETSKPIVEAGRLVAHCREHDILAEDLYCRKELFFEGAN